MMIVKATEVLILGLIFVFGVWLLFWNPVDFATQGLDHGVWDWSILTEGWLSMVIGAAIIYGWYKLFRMRCF